MPGPTAPPQAAGSTNPAEPKASQEAAPGTVARPPDIPPLWQGTARHGEAAEVLRRNADGTYQVRRSGGPEETFKESQVAAMTRMQKPELHAHIAQALKRQEEVKASMAEASAIAATLKSESSTRIISHEQVKFVVPGYFKSGKIGLVEIPSVDGLNLQMPNGNETGANENWLPGGKLPRTPAFDGMPEAIIDLKGYDNKHWPFIDLNLP